MMMTEAQIKALGDVAAKAAFRAIDKGEQLGGDKNRAQFVSMVHSTLLAIPVSQRSDEVQHFLQVYQDGAFGASALNS